MLDLIHNLHETETKVFGSNEARRADGQSPIDKNLLGANSSPDVLKWFRLTSLHDLIHRSLLMHSPSEQEILAMANGIVARNNMQRDVDWSLPGEDKPVDEPEVVKAKETPKKRSRKDLN